MNRSLFALVILLSLFNSGLIRAQDAPATPKKIHKILLVLHPAREPRPALKYQLLPPTLDCKPGNAALAYTKLALITPQFGGMKLQTWLLCSADKLPLEEIRNEIAKQNCIDDLNVAARLKECDWHVDAQQKMVELRRVRDFTGSLAVQARVQISEGQFDKASYTLQSGFSLAQQAGEAPLPYGIQASLVAEEILLRPLYDWVQKSDSPSLYWALTFLPQPFTIFRNGLEVDSAQLYLCFPELAPFRREPLKPGLFDRLLRHMYAENVEQVKPERVLQARTRLLERGHSENEIDQMNATQLLGIDALENRDEVHDRLTRLLYLPHWQARPLIESELAYHQKSGEEKKLFIGGTGLPTVALILTQTAWFDRNLAVLRLVEAIRLYAAKHAGKLPMSIAEITEVPVPDDPMTGKAFEYQYSDEGGGKVVIPWPESDSFRTAFMQYELQMAK